MNIWLSVFHIIQKSEELEILKKKIDEKIRNKMKMKLKNKRMKLRKKKWEYKSRRNY